MPHPCPMANHGSSQPMTPDELKNCLCPMANHGLSKPMTPDEFKNWLMKFDKKGDGRISKKELRKAIHDRGQHWCFFKAMRGMKEADTNHNGFIDDCEIENLVDFARDVLKINITPY